MEGKSDKWYSHSHFSFECVVCHYIIYYHCLDFVSLIHLIQAGQKRVDNAEHQN